MSSSEIPENDDYYLHIALAVARRSSCVGRKSGAVLVKDDRIIAAGYSATPSGLASCAEGGCGWCNDHSVHDTRTGADRCLCVHAEANALMTAARHGVAVDGALLYTTDQPCFSCSTELIQAGIAKVVYARAWAPGEAVAADYGRLQRRINSHQLESTMDDSPPATVHDLPEIVSNLPHPNGAHYLVDALPGEVNGDHM